MFIDAHTHLSSIIRKGEPTTVEELMERAAAVGVGSVITVSDDMAESEEAVKHAQQNENVYCSLAFHPTNAHELDEECRARMQELVRDPKCVAIGETGLDEYWIGKMESCPELPVQEEAFRWHIALARDVDKPVMIHSRDADENLLRVLRDEELPREVMLHCFSSPMETAREALDLGCVLSFCGNTTFKRNDYLREVAAYAPLDRILIETDAPFMSPEPKRGRRNEPSHIVHTYQCVADARGMSLEALEEAVEQNFHRIFRV
ncbi:MAG: TatD family hydrolase [Corynebacterium sp.]|nr:TatD family hydrolase [Corynebacterium sp.]